MPSALVKKYADKADISVGQAEHRWEKAKKLADEKFSKKSKSYWAYVVGIFKRMMGEDTSMMLSDYLLLEAEQLDEKVKPSYVKGLNRAEKKEMKHEIERFSKMDHKDKAAYPDDWTADQKYKARLKKKGKSLPKSEWTKKFEKRYGK